MLMKPTQKLTISINPLIIIVVLLVVIVGMIGLWRPWETGAPERTITVTGQGSVDSTPDEFVFSPYFQRTGEDTAALKAELDTFGNKLLNDLVKLGVPKDDITLNSNSYDAPSMGATEPAQPEIQREKQSDTATLHIVIKTSNQALTQKVQDHLATTDAQGQLTATPQFSKQKNDKLESQAREEAIKDARQKADKTAKDLQVSIGKVISVKESAGQSPVFPITADSAERSTSSLPVTPGTSTASTTVEVVFELK